MGPAAVTSDLKWGHPHCREAPRRFSSLFPVTPKARWEPASHEGLPAGWACWPHPPLQHQTTEQPGPTLAQCLAATQRSHAAPPARPVPPAPGGAPPGVSSCCFLFSLSLRAEKLAPARPRLPRSRAKARSSKAPSRDQPHPAPEGHRWPPGRHPARARAPGTPDLAWLQRGRAPGGARPPTGGARTRPGPAPPSLADLPLQRALRL